MNIFIYDDDGLCDHSSIRHDEIDDDDEEPDEDDPEEEAEEEGVQVETDDGVPAEMEQLAPNQPASDGDDELN